MPGPDSLPSKEKKPPKTTGKRLLSTLIWAAVFLIGLFLLLEGAARSGILNKLSPRESLGIYPTPMGQYFEIKWAGLQQYVAQNGGVDVILIGSSVVNTGIDPDVVAATYFNLTGIHLRIYNFGVEGLDIVPNSVYAQILVQKYHPALIIYGTIPRDFLAGDNAEVNQHFLSSPWIQYMSGEWNLAGFLIDHSAALRSYLPYRNWMRSDFLDTLYSIDHRVSRTTSSGYEPDNYIGINLDQAPDPASPEDQDTFNKYRDFKVDPVRMGDLQKILNLQKIRSTRVIVMDVPPDPTFYDYMGGLPVYQEFQREISSAVTSSGGLYYPFNGDPQIPANGRSDRAHLNKIGAPIFSTYMGTQLAILTTVNGIQFTNPGQGSP